MEITIVKEENQRFFEPLMPKEMWREADLVFGAVCDGTACGVLALAVSDSVIRILYLYVAEQFRRRGGATDLLSSLHELAYQTETDAAIFQFSSDETTAAVEKCLEKNLFERDSLSNPIYVTTLGDVSPRLAQGKTEAHSQAVPLSQATSPMWNSLTEALAKLPNEDGTVPELDVRSRYDQEASFLLVRSDGTRGCILFDRQEDGYILSYFCALKDVSPKEMMSLFAASYAVLKRRCGDDTPICINALTETTQKMVTALTDGKAKKAGQAVIWYCLY